jgi:hypothetical protein
MVDQTPEEVFNAINNPRGWWSEEIEGNTNKLIMSLPITTKMFIAPNKINRGEFPAKKCLADAGQLFQFCQRETQMKG